MRFLLSLLTWYHAETLGTRLFTWRRGIKVGEDEHGNVYYRNAKDSRRWVIYAGEPDATKVSADWHGWLHHTFDNNPADHALKHKAWEKPRVENATGTDAAYVPAGSLRQSTPAVQEDYQAWQPQ